MDALTRQDIVSLAQKGQGPCVSIFMPTERLGPDARTAEQTRLRNLLRKAERMLLDKGMRAPEVETLLRPGRDLASDGLFWQHQSDGLALFLTQAGPRYFRVPVRFQEAVLDGERCHIRPLLPLLEQQVRFFALALSQNANRLLGCDDRRCEHISVVEMPGSLDEVLKYDTFGKEGYTFRGARPGTASARAGTGAGGTSYSAGPAVTQDRVDEWPRYMKAIDKALHLALNGQGAPLVVACVEELWPYFKQANTYSQLVEEHIQGNPDGWQDEELRTRALEVVRRLQEQKRAQALSVFAEKLSTDRTATAPDKIVEAAMQGRIDTLFVDPASEVWGAYDGNTGHAEIHKRRGDGDEDLVDLAALGTLERSGLVYALPTDMMPEHRQAAALLRY